MSPYTNGRVSNPEPPLSVIESDVPEGVTLPDYRRQRVLLIDKRMKRRWRWRLVQR